jgi:glycerol-3-phosphate acyltransferase PlsY
MNYVLIALFSYLAGSLPSAWIAGKLRGTDIRAAGSGNVGATNALRVLGPLPAALTLAADVGKGLLAVLVLSGWGGADPAWARPLAGAAGVLGHVFPVWLKFRGGKGVAVGAAAAAAIAPWAALASLAAFAAAVALTRYVSLGSMSAAAALPLAYLLAYRGAAFSPAAFGFCLAAAVLVLVLHRRNIGRLRRGQEPRLGETATAGAPR